METALWIVLLLATATGFAQQTTPKKAVVQPTRAQLQEKIAELEAQVDYLLSAMQAKQANFEALAASCQARQNQRQSWLECRARAESAYNGNLKATGTETWVSPSGQRLEKPVYWLPQEALLRLDRNYEHDLNDCDRVYPDH